MTPSQNTPGPAEASKKHPREPRERAFALQIVAAQVIFTGVLVLLGLLLSDQEIRHRVAIAILCGGIISSLANLWLAIVAFRPRLGQSPQRMLAAFYMGELGKFVLIAVGFLLVFKKIAILKEPSYALLLFASFLMVQFTVWIYPLVRRQFFAGLAKINRR